LVNFYIPYGVGVGVGVGVLVVVTEGVIEMVGVTVLVIVGVTEIVGVLVGVCVGVGVGVVTSTVIQNVHSATLIITSNPQLKSHVIIFFISHSLASIILIMICGAKLNKVGSVKIWSGDAVEIVPNKLQLFS
jgi:hypothetical protein